MGRVSRYKKTKSFDKQHRGGEYVWGTTELSSKKKRSKTAEKLLAKKLKRKQRDQTDGGFNLPVEKDDFDLKDMVVRKEKRSRLDDCLKSQSTTSVVSVAPSLKPKAVVTTNKVNIGGKTVSVTIPEDEVAEKRTARSLNIDLKTGQSKAEKKSSIEARRPGESMTAFRQRMKVEVKKALGENIKQTKRNSNSVSEEKVDENGEEKKTRSQKKKEFLNMKKKAKKSKKAGVKGGYESDDYFNEKIMVDNNDTIKEGFLTGEQAAAQISFLEQADRPPIFEQLPRGAQNKSKLKMKGSEGEKSVTSSKIDEEKIKAEQSAMEIMRRKVQNQYALLRAKRQSQRSS
jgi:hypothetical protein